MTITKYQSFIIFFLLAFFCEITFAQNPTNAIKSVWFPIGGFKDKSTEVGLSEENRQNSFKGKVSGKYDVAFVRAIVKELAKTAHVDVELRFTDLPDHNVKAYKETIEAKHGSVVIENAFMTKYLTAKDKGSFFKAIIAHEIGHIALMRNKIPFLLEFSNQFKIAKNKIAPPFTLEFQEEIFCDLLGGYYLRLTDANSAMLDYAPKIVRSFDKFGDERELQKRSHGAPFTRGVLFYIGLKLTDNEQMARYQGDWEKTPMKVEFMGFNDTGSLYLAYHFKPEGRTIFQFVLHGYCHPDIPTCDEMLGY